jgi:hypothetical protein
MATKSDAERKELLASLGLGDRAKVEPKTNISLAPEGVDPHTMPVSDIVWDPALLNDFTDLTGSGMAAASRHLFELYKSPGRNKDRNSLLHRKIGEFILQVRRSRETGGFVTEKIKANKEERDLAALLAQHKITAADLASLIKAKEMGA